MEQYWYIVAVFEDETRALVVRAESIREAKLKVIDAYGGFLETEHEQLLSEALDEIGDDVMEVEQL